MKTKSEKPLDLCGDDFHQAMARPDDTPDNASTAPSLGQLTDSSRRSFLAGSLAAAVSALFADSLALPEPANADSKSRPPGFKGAADGSIGFQPIAPVTDPNFDQVQVPEGYQARAFFSWGDPVARGAQPWHPDASDTWEAQALQAGQNHDGMAYFPFPDAADEHGLLVVNHEYANPTLHPRGFTRNTREDGSVQRPEAEVRKEQMAHGVSIIELRRDRAGRWNRTRDSPFGRRVTALTPMTVTGPLAGSELMKTAADPSGLEILGTINNCAMGVTPWGTYLTCEENWRHYFVNRDRADFETRVAHRRYGISNSLNSKYYAWESIDDRFDATPDHGKPFQGYVNEPNRFGWVVEIDPFDPQGTPRKRTALGRLARECATVALDDDGRMAVYSGDDTRGEYVYKFVCADRYRKGDRKHNDRLLDQGTLFVAVFHKNGRGAWRALRHGNGGLTARNGFHSQEDVFVNARAAADILGATPMDRPEWVAVQPGSRDVYVALTNNKDRGNKPDQEVGPANPRPTNLHGQILRWKEHNAMLDATAFCWEVFLLAGDRAGDGSPDHLTGNIDGDIFSSPDGLWFDAQGRLWIQTDYRDQEGQNAAMGCNQMLCADPATREVKRFLVGPRGCEVSGIAMTPNGRTLWVNIQHPGISFPASDAMTRPRSTTLLITRDDGGVIGT